MHNNYRSVFDQCLECLSQFLYSISYSRKASCSTTLSTITENDLVGLLPLPLKDCTQYLRHVMFCSEYLFAALQRIGRKARKGNRFQSNLIIFKLSIVFCSFPKCSTVAEFVHKIVPHKNPYGGTTDGTEHYTASYRFLAP